MLSKLAPLMNLSSYSERSEVQCFSAVLTLWLGVLNWTPGYLLIKIKKV